MISLLCGTTLAAAQAADPAAETEEAACTLPGLRAETWADDGTITNGEYAHDAVSVGFVGGRLACPDVLVEEVTVIVGERVFVAPSARLSDTEVVLVGPTASDAETLVRVDLAASNLVFADGHVEPLEPWVADNRPGWAGAAVGHRSATGWEARTSTLFPAGRRAVGLGAGGGPDAAVATLALLDATGERSRADVAWFDGTHSGLVRAAERLGFANGDGLLSFDADYAWASGRPAFALDTPGSIAATDRLTLGASIAAGGVRAGLRYDRERPAFVAPRRLDAVDGDLFVTERFGPARPTLHVAGGHHALDSLIVSGVAARARTDVTTASARLALTVGAELRTGSTTLRDRDEAEEGEPESLLARGALVGSTGFLATSADATVDATLFEGSRAALEATAFATAGTDTGDIAPRDARLWAPVADSWRIATGPSIYSRGRIPVRASWLAGFARETESSTSTLRLTTGRTPARVELGLSSGAWGEGPTEAVGGVHVATDQTGWDLRLVWTDTDGADAVRPAPAPLRDTSHRLVEGTTLVTTWRQEFGQVSLSAEIAVARIPEARMGGFGGVEWESPSESVGLAAVGGRGIANSEPTVFVAFRAGAHPGIGPVPRH